MRVGSTKVVKGRKYVLNKAHRWAGIKVNERQKLKLARKAYNYRVGTAQRYRGLNEYYNNPHLSIREKGTLALKLYKQNTQLTARKKFISKMEKLFASNFDISGKSKLYNPSTKSLNKIKIKRRK